jgi:hypothetical protein
MKREFASEILDIEDLTEKGRVFEVSVRRCSACVHVLVHIYIRIYTGVSILHGARARIDSRPGAHAVQLSPRSRDPSTDELDAQRCCRHIR